MFQFQFDPKAARELIQTLVYIASINGPISPQRQSVINALGQRLGLSPTAILQLTGRFNCPPTDSERQAFYLASAVLLFCDWQQCEAHVLTWLAQALQIQQLSSKINACAGHGFRALAGLTAAPEAMAPAAPQPYQPVAPVQVQRNDATTPKGTIPPGINPATWNARCLAAAVQANHLNMMQAEWVARLFPKYNQSSTSIVSAFLHHKMLTQRQAAALSKEVAAVLKPTSEPAPEQASTPALEAAVEEATPKQWRVVKCHSCKKSLRIASSFKGSVKSCAECCLQRRAEQPATSPDKPAVSSKKRARRPAKRSRASAPRKRRHGTQMPMMALVGITAFLALSGAFAFHSISTNKKLRQKLGAVQDRSHQRPGDDKAARSAAPKKIEETAKPKINFDSGRPSLPKNPAPALALAQAYEKAKKNDLNGIIKLYQELLEMAPADTDTTDLENHIDGLQKRQREGRDKQYQAALKDGQMLVRSEDYNGALKLFQKARKTLKTAAADSELLDDVDRQIDQIKESQRAHEALSKLLASTPPFSNDQPADLALLGTIGKSLQSLRHAKAQSQYKGLYKRALQERQLLRQQRRLQALGRLAQARTTITEDAADTKMALVERVRIARERTLKRPFQFAGGSHILALEENRFTLSAKGGRIEASFRFGLRPEITAQVLKQACRPNNIDDLVEYLIFSLKHDLFPDAAYATRKITRLDSDLGKVLPDLKRLKRRAKIFSGTAIRGKKKAGAVYHFARARNQSVLDDWSAYDKNTQLKIRYKKGLQVTGENQNLKMKEIGFENGLTVELDWPESPECDALLILGLDIVGKKGTRITVYISPKQKAIKLIAAIGTAELSDKLDWLRGTGEEKIRLSVRGERATLSLGQSRQSIKIPRFQRTLVELSGVAKTALATNSITWPRIQIEGQPRKKWKRKNRVALKQTMHSEMLKLQQARDKRKRNQRSRAPVDDDRATDSLPSCDDPLTLASLNAQELKEYRKAWKDFEGGKLQEASQAFESFIQSHDQLPGPYLARSIMCMVAEQFKEAQSNLESALALEPNFPEALILRSRLGQIFGKLEDARKDLTRVLELAPDLSIGYQQRALLALKNEDFKQALQDLTVAIDLDPGNVETYRHYLSVRQVAQGPPWAKTYLCKSTHFIVKTNISQTRAHEIAAMLEKARTYYATVIPDTTIGQPVKRAVCLVFDTDIGLFNYSALMFGEKHDPQVLGLYTPLYKQLLFFEDKNDANGDEFRHVLYHEGFHRYSDEVMPGLPIWMDEGLAELFAGELCSADGILEGRLSNLEDGFEYGVVVPISRLMAMSQAQFYDKYAPFNYAAAWALCRYLIRGRAKEQDRFRALIALLQKTQPYSQALLVAFKDVDFQDLDKRWRAAVRGMRR
jgi:hypothetical protein